MIDARRAESAAKRARVLAAVEEMAGEDVPVTFARVARRAGVSTWLVYSPGVREAIEAARARQDHPRSPGRRTDGDPAGSTDLALARAEITRLRAERDEHQRQLRLALGSRMDNIAKADLLVRVDELTRHNDQLAATAQRYESDNHTLSGRVTELEDDLAAARTSLRRMIRAENAPSPS